MHLGQLIIMVKKKNIQNNSGFVFVETLSGLRDVLRILKRKKVVGVDLEADSMFHFKEKVCLIQIAIPDTVFIIDPLAVKDLTPLQQLFENKKIKKVFHGADYDVRSLYRDFRICIENLLDTELACRFLGMEQTSLEKVILKYFDEPLDKKYQKKDWSQRPIPKQMVEYAAKDAFYLIPLAQSLEKQLIEKNRLTWVIEECELLRRVRPSEISALPLYMNFKGAGKLKPRELAVLEELLFYRMQLARQYDKPLFKVIGNHSLLILANKKPANSKELEKSKALSAMQTERFGITLLGIIQKALNIPENELPVYPRGKATRYRASVVKRIKALKTWKEEKAGTLKIDPSLVLNKAQMLAIANKNPFNIETLMTVDRLKKWQIKEFGQEIIGILNQC
jgi:ribonuclease D